MPQPSPTPPPGRLPCSSDRIATGVRPRRITSPASPREDKASTSRDASGTSTPPLSLSSRPLRLSLPPTGPRRSSLPHARRGRRHSPSFTRPPCPPRRPKVSPRTAVARCCVWCSPLETGAPTTNAPSSPSSSDAGDPLLPRRRPAAPKHPRALLAPRGELLYLLPLSASSLALRSYFPARARTPRRGARRRRVSGDQMVTGVGPLARPQRAAPT